MSPNKMHGSEGTNKPKMKTIAENYTEATKGHFSEWITGKLNDTAKGKEPDLSLDVAISFLTTERKEQFNKALEEKLGKKSFEAHSANEFKVQIEVMKQILASMSSHERKEYQKKSEEHTTKFLVENRRLPLGHRMVIDNNDSNLGSRPSVKV